MFLGFPLLESTLVGTLLVVDSNGTPINADAFPTFRVYGPDGFVIDGTTSERINGVITNATNATPIVITAASHGLTTGAYVTIDSVEGNTAANGTFVVTRVNANTFSLDGSAGNGAYTTGGTYNAAGLYETSLTVAGVSGFEAGELYQIVYDYALSAVQQGQVQSFQVN